MDPAASADIAHAGPPTGRRAQLRRVLSLLVPVAMLALVGWALHATLARHGLDAIVAGLTSIPAERVWLAALMTLVSFLLLVAIDRLAVSYAARVAEPSAPVPKVRLRRVAFSSFIAYAFGHTLGFSMFTGTALRYRSYSLCGMTAAQVAIIAVFCSLTTGLGLLLSLGVGVLAAHEFAANLPVPLVVVLGVAGLATALVLGYIAWSAQSRGVLRLRGFALAPAGLPIALGQTALAVAEVLAMAAVLWALLPPGAPSFLAFTAIFSFAQFLGLSSQVPGGLGVFELAVISAMPDIPAPALAGALVAYRVVYFVMPLLLAAIALFVHELIVVHGRVGALLAGSRERPRMP